MTDPADTRFFQALKDISAQEAGVDPSCREVISRALKTGDPLDMRAARIAVDRLDADVRDRVMAQVHRRMATDLSAIWGALSTAPDGNLPN